MPSTAKQQQPTGGYRVLAEGIEYGDTRVERGEIAKDIPPASVKWLLSQNLIAPASEKVPKDEAPSVVTLDEPHGVIDEAPPIAPVEVAEPESESEGGED